MVSSHFSAFLRSKSGQRAAFKVAAATSMIAMPTAVVMLDDAAHPLHMQWTHTGYFTSYDCGALRRGFQVYRQVCATCHSVTGIRWRELVGVTHNEDALKEMAKECDYVDGPNGDGEMFERPGKMTDRLPAPYENKEQGRAANGGALPPDLTLMVKARHSGLDYLFSLLTGYDEPPTGKEVMPGLYYNPYFPGGAIAMPPPLSDGGVEYEDGTISTISQQAYDICQFLNWTAEPEADERKKWGTVYFATVIFATLATGYYKRFKWNLYKTRQISYINPNQIPRK